MIIVKPVSVFLSFVVEIGCSLLLLRCNCGTKKRYANQHKYLVVTVLASSALLLWNHYAEPPGNFLIYLGGQVVVSIGYSAVFLNRGFFCKTTTIIVYFVCLLELHAITSRVGMHLFSGLDNGSPLHMLFSKSLLALVTFLMMHYPLKTKYKLKSSYWVLIMPMVVIVPFMSFFSAFDSTVRTTLYQVCILVLTVGFYCLVSYLLRDNDRHLQSKLANQSLSMQQDNWQNMKALQDKIRKLNHDMHNHMVYIESLAQSRDFEGLTNYLSHINGEIRPREQVLATGNQVMDAILNVKSASCAQNGIPIDIKVIGVDGMELPDYDLCAVLSNLLDNAIDASKAETSPDIQVEIRMVKNFLYLSVSNRVRADVLSQNPELATTKKDRTQHGLGLSIVRDVVAEYDGSLNLFQKDGYFHAHVMLQVALARQIV